MQEIYASLLLHDQGKPINEENLKKVLVAAGAEADPARLKAVVASLDGVNIEEAIKQAAIAPQAAQAAPAEAKKEEKKEEKKEDQEKAAADAASGLSALFG